jgi:hypothetical protein
MAYRQEIVTLSGGGKLNCRWKPFLGFDKHSIFADPEFVDPEHGDYRLKPESPALQLGLKNIDPSTVGLLRDFPRHWLASDRG